MMTFHFATQLAADKVEKTLTRAANKWNFWISALNMALKKKGKTPTDGIKDHKALLLLVPSPFKEMMWTIFPSCNSQGS